MPQCMSCNRDDVQVKTFTDPHGDLWLCRDCAEYEDEHSDPYDWDGGRHWREYDVESLNDA